MRVTLFKLFIYALLPIIVLRPTFGIFVYTFFNLIRPEMLFWGQVSLGGKSLFLIMAATLLGLVFNMRLEFKPFMQWSLLNILWIYGAVCVTIWTASYHHVTLKQWPYANELIKIAIVCYLIFVLINKRDILYKYFDLHLTSSTLLAVWGIEQYFRGNSRLEGLGGEAISDSNYAASYFVLILPLAINKFLYGEGRWKLAGALSSAAIFAVIICTQSRGGFLGLATCCGIFVVTSRQRKKLLLIGMLLLLAASPFLTGEYMDRMATMKSIDTMDASGKSRLALWEAAWMIFKDHPILGCGYQCFPHYKMMYANEFVGKLDDDWIQKFIMRPKVTHSLFFQILSEGGLFVFIPVMTIYFGTMIANTRCWLRYRHVEGREAEKMRSYLNGLTAGLAGWLVTMVFLDGLIGFFSYIFVTLATITREQLALIAKEQLGGKAQVEVVDGGRADPRLEPAVARGRV